MCGRRRGGSSALPGRHERAGTDAPPQRRRTQLAPLIETGLVATCPVIDMEVLFSTRTPAEYVQVSEDRSRAYEYLPIDDQVWRRAEAVQAVLAQRSRLRSVRIPDLLVAAVAYLHRIPVLHYDADYEHVASVTEQDVRWVVPRGSVP